MKKQVPLYLLCIVCLLSLFLFLGEAFFNTRGEPREAIVAYSMLEHGNWILPVNNGDEIAFKPPFLHWCIAALSWLAGGVSEFTARFPSALSLSLMTLAVYAFYARRRGTELALLTALLTLSNFEVHRAGMACRVDMLLAALMVGALLALFRWSEEHERGVPWVAWLCLSGAALTKGPVGALLPCAVTGVYLLLRGRSLWYAFWRLTLLAVASLLPLGVWYYFAYCEPHGGARFLGLIYEENVLRLIGKMSYESHVNPWPYNVMTVLTGFVPYTLILLFLLPAAGRALGRRFARRSKADTTVGRWWQAVQAWAVGRWQWLRSMDDARLFSLLSTVIIFVFYCIPKSKRSTYLLPIYPFVAYFVAEGLLWLRSRRPRVLLVFGRTLVVLSGVLTVAFLLVKGGTVRTEWLGGSHAAENMAYLAALRDTHLSFLQILAVVAPVATAGWFLIKSTFAERTTHPTHWPAAIAGMALGLFFALDGFYLPAVLNVKSDRAVARQIAAIQPEGTLYSYRSDVLEANRMHPFTINFYLDDRIIPIDKAPEAPRGGLLVTGDEEIENFRRAYPQYDTLLLLDSGHRSCDDKKVVKLYAFSERVIQK